MKVAAGVIWAMGLGIHIMIDGGNRWVGFDSPKLNFMQILVFNGGIFSLIVVISIFVFQNASLLKARYFYSIQYSTHSYFDSYTID